MNYTPTYFSGETLVNSLNEKILILNVVNGQYRFVYYPTLKEIHYEDCRRIDLLFCLDLPLTLEEHKRLFEKLNVVLQCQRLNQ